MPILSDVNASNCVPVLLFSHQIGMQSFLETFAHLSSANTFSTFLDSLVNSIGLLRGVRAVISPWWQTLQTTEVGRILEDTSFDHMETPGVECTGLSTLVEEAEMVEEHRNTYKETIARLQRQFDQSRQITEDHLATSK